RPRRSRGAGRTRQAARAPCRDSPRARARRLRTAARLGTWRRAIRHPRPGRGAAPAELATRAGPRRGARRPDRRARGGRRREGSSRRLRGVSRADRVRRGTHTEREGLVGATGFEPATPCTPCRCATKLRYAPTEASNAVQKSGREHSRGARATQQDCTLARRGAARRGGRLRTPRVRAEFSNGALAAGGARRLALQARGERAELLFHLEHQQPAVGLAERELHLRLVELAIVEQRAARTGDRVAALIEQLLDPEQQPH